MKTLWVRFRLPMLLTAWILSAWPAWAALGRTSGFAEPDSPTAAMDGSASSDLLEHAAQLVAEAEYEITWQEATAREGRAETAYQAPNRAHDLRTTFTPRGIRVAPRTDRESSWTWSLELLGVGRGHAILAAKPASLRPERNRIGYERGDLTEWYVNDTKGLEQGFLLSKPPQSDPEAALSEGSDLVAIELALGGTLSAFPASDGQAIEFRNGRGESVLRYSELHVSDTNGRPLPARMELVISPEGARIRLLFDDVNAVYPVTVDPLTTSPAWIMEIGQTGAQFGVSVASAGDVNADGYSDVIIGAYLFDNGSTNEGRAYLFLGSASGLLSSVAWTAEANQASARFGFSVASAGDVNGDGYSDVIVGAYGYDGGETDEGRAYVYLGSATGLSSSPAWTAECNQAGALFGVAVGTAGDVNGDGYSDVIVGAQLYDNGQTNEGAAFVYHGSAAGLSATPNGFRPEANEIGAELGVSVGTAGDVNGDGYADIVVGELRHGSFTEGAAIIFYGSSSGLTGAGRAINGTVQDAMFGNSVATAGDVNGDGYADIIIGAYHHSNGQTEEGKVYVYHGSSTGITTVPAWEIESNQAGAQIGASVGTAGDVNGDGFADVIFGGPLVDHGEVDEGRAYVYLGSASGLGGSAAWVAENDQAGAQFGTSVATAGDVNGDGFSDVLAGSPLFTNGQTNEGRAYCYHGSAAGPASVPGWTLAGDQVSGVSQIGDAVAAAGDFNGDGYGDVVLADQNYGPSARGGVLLHLGSAAGVGASPACTFYGSAAPAYNFGNAVASAGDVNGDGFDDIIVGAQSSSPGGYAFVYYGSAAGCATTPDWTAAGGQPIEYFGTSVAMAGDVNGDGFSDVIIGAYNYDNGQNGEGRAYVYLGSASGLLPYYSWTVESNQAGAGLGWSVASAGDVNRDGYSDVIVGAFKYDTSVTDGGRAYVYLGSASGLASTPSWTTDGTDASGWLGYAVATAGDVDGDGYSDVIVGAPNVRFSTAPGRAFVFRGSASGVVSTPAWTVQASEGDTAFARAVSTAGDLNGDGYADVVLGQPYWKSGTTEVGRALVYLGSASGLATDPATTAQGSGFDHLGDSLGAGDVDGDGYADIVVGAPVHSPAGQVRIYNGNGGRGRNLNPRQRRADDSVPIAHLGRSDASSGFRLKLRGSLPFGRGKVRLEQEVKPFGVAFNGLATVVDPVAQDTGTSGVQLGAQVTGLLDDRPYHWRVRLRYGVSTSPFAQHSRWVTVPWKGWQETMLRTASSLAAGRVTDLMVAKQISGAIALSWDASCLVTDSDYEAYEGALGNFTSHAPRLCSTGGATTGTFTPAAGNRYYLVVPKSSLWEGSYGTTSTGAERPRSASACLTQQIRGCP